MSKNTEPCSPLEILRPHGLEYYQPVCHTDIWCFPTHDPVSSHRYCRSVAATCVGMTPEAAAPLTYEEVVLDADEEAAHLTVAQSLSMDIQAAIQRAFKTDRALDRVEGRRAFLAEARTMITVLGTIAATYSVYAGMSTAELMVALSSTLEKVRSAMGCDDELQN